MSLLNDTPYLTTLRAESDYSDTKFVVGSGDLKDVIARMFSYMPLWLRALYTVRIGLAAILRLDSVGLPSTKKYSADDVSMTSGEKLSWITVERAEDGQFWSGRIEDKHLDAWLVVTRDEMLDNLSRFGLSTYVQFHNRSGRFYFRLIKPFHHFVVNQMLTNAVKS
jgi:Protein of unknown function (DUF2867)